jgi:hypothetical protein
MHRPFGTRQRHAPRPAAGRRKDPRLGVEPLEDRTVPSGNPIVTENQLPGTPQSIWGVVKSGDATIQGFATDISANHGQTVSFKINDTANVAYHVDIYRMGYYQGNGARLVATIPSSQTVKKVQPAPLTDTPTGLVDAGNWSVTASWAVPTTAVSGLYFARATRDDTGGATLIWFVVRNDEGASDLLFQTSDTTWQAYNQWGGNSLYLGTAPTTDGRALKVSYNRPLTVDDSSDGYGDYNSPLHTEYPMIRWLEANGYDVGYSTDVDTDRRGAELLEHKVFMSVGHDEYWSGGQRANVEAARDAGVNLAFFSGNESYWKVRWENGLDASGSPYRTLVCYKESKDSARTDPLDVSQNVWTGTWRDNRFSPPADGGRPENAMSGTAYMNDRTSVELGLGLTVGDQDGKLRFWRNTAVANLAPGQSTTLGQYVVGYETDEDLDNGFRPAGLIDMSSTTFTTAEHVIVPWGTQVGSGTSTHKLTLYRAPNGALVFGAGTVQWSWGLDGTHNDTSTTPDPSIRQATVNLFADMGVQPATLQAGLVAATASADHTNPTSVITGPAAGTVYQVGATITVTGTATDAGGGVVGGVEVSTDGGATWHPAAGRGNWTYTWSATTAGTTSIRSRAVDDSGNLETPAAGTSVVISTSNTYVAGYSFDEPSGSTAADASGKGNTGTLTAATRVPGKYGGALSFNGFSSWVTVAGSNSLNLTAAMTLEAWVKPAALGGWEAVLLKEASNGLDYALYANESPSRPSGFANISGADREAYGTGALPVNTWSHLAATYDGATLKMYVNANLVGSTILSGPIRTSTNALRIGGDSIWGEYFNGLIDEVRVYSRALQPGEIQTDMSTPVGTPDSQAPTAPASLTATGSVNSVGLSWPTSTDNTGVDHYNVYRSATSGFTPGAGNLVGQPITPGYTDPGLAPGAYYYRVAAADGAGNLSGPSPEASAAVTGDVTAPTVSITAPTNNATVAGSVGVTANASDNVGVASVQFYLDGNTALGSPVTTTPYTVTWNTAGAGNRTHTLTAVASDAAGNSTTSAVVTVTVNNVTDATPPTVSISSPTGGATVSGTVTVSATASDNVGVAGVQFKLDGANLQAEDTAAPYSVSWNTATAGNGTHTLTAVARDAAGNTTTSAGVTVTVNNVAATGLVGAWGFEEGSGATTADASGHALAGTLTNAAWAAAGKFGKAISFNGTNAWVTVADNALLHLTTGLTVEAWVKPAAASTDWTAAVLKERGTTGLAYGLYAADGPNKPPAGYINRSGTVVEAAGASALPLNAWTHLAVTYDATTIRLYVNGTQVGTKAQTGSINSSTAPLRFGGDSVWGEYFNGLIDEVRVYSVALTAAQVQADMNTPVGSPQLAAEGAAPPGAVPVLTAADLVPVAAEAVRRWVAAGATPAQAALLSRVRYQIVDFGAAPELGWARAGGAVVELDDDGAGRGWFVDPTPADDAEFGRSPAPGGYDLLTVVMHELGHVLGRDDLGPGSDPDDLMAAALPTGTRRSPTVTDLDPADTLLPPAGGRVDTVAVPGSAFAAPEFVGAASTVPDAPGAGPVARAAGLTAILTGGPVPPDRPTGGERHPLARLEPEPGAGANPDEDPWGVWVGGDDPFRD